MKKFLGVALILLVAIVAEEPVQHVEPRYKLLEEVASKMIDLVSGAIKAQQKVFEEMIAAGEASKHKDDPEFVIQLQQFAALLESMKQIEAEGEEDSLHLTLRLFTIYENMSTLTYKYDITNSRLPTKERLIAKLLKEAGHYKAQLQFYQNLLATSKTVKTLVQNYYDNLNEAEKMKELKMLDWLKQSEMPQSHGVNLEALFEFFDIYA